MADPDLYKAALEYHETDNYVGPQLSKENCSLILERLMVRMLSIQ